MKNSSEADRLGSTIRSLSSIATLASVPGTANGDSPDRREIVFVDSAVTSFEGLVAGIDTACEVVTLDADGDGVRQIIATVADSGGTPYSTVRVIAEGAGSGLRLGAVELTEDNLSEYDSELAALRENLAQDADILLLDGNEAALGRDVSLADALSVRTGVNVVASSVLNSELPMGDIEAAAVLQAETLTETADGGIVQASEVAAADSSSSLLPVIPAEFQDIVDYIVADFENDPHGNWPLFVSEYGQSATVTYSFMGAAPEEAVYDLFGDTQFFEFDTGQAAGYDGPITISGQKDAVRRILQTVSSFTNVEFVEVTGDSGREGQIRFANTGEDTSAYTLFGDDFRDVWISDNFPYSGTYENTTYAYQTLLHEIYHALGLNHPGPYNGTAEPEDQVFDADYLMYTQMSYFARADGWQIWGVDSDGTIYVEDKDGNYRDQSGNWYQGGMFTGPALLDVAALQTIYGVKDVRAQDTQYVFYTNPAFTDYDYDYVLQPGADSAYLLEAGQDGDTFGIYVGNDAPESVTIIDTGGHDSIDVSSVYSAYVDLAAGEWYTLDRKQEVDNPPFCSIAFGTEIEDVVAGQGLDRIYGNDLDNLIQTGDRSDYLDGRGGNDILQGGAGNDHYDFNYVWGNDVIIDSDHSATINFTGWEQDGLDYEVNGSNLQLFVQYEDSINSLEVVDYFVSPTTYKFQFWDPDVILILLVEDDKTIDVDYNGSEVFSIRRPVGLYDGMFTMRIDTLPDKGSVFLDDGTELYVGESLTVEQLNGLVFSADADFWGSAGSLGYSVINTHKTLSATVDFNVIRPDNLPPVVGDDITLVFSLNSSGNTLGLSAPTDLDDNIATITVTGVPENGIVGNGGAAVSVGDVLTSEELVALTYTPDGASGGEAGVFSYVVEDTEGASADQAVTIRLDAGNTPDEAADLGDLTASSWSGSDIVGGTDAADFFTFTLDRISDFSLALTGLSANADLTLYSATQVYNARTGQYVEKLSVVSSLRNGGTADETLGRGLDAGTYYVKVTGGETGYDLDMSAVNLPENGSGTGWKDALDLGTLDTDGVNFSDWVGSLDTSDSYRFHLDGPTDSFSFSVAGESALVRAPSLTIQNSAGGVVYTNRGGGSGFSEAWLGLDAGEYLVSLKALDDNAYSLTMGLAGDTPSGGAGTSDADEAGNAVFSAYDAGTIDVDGGLSVTDWIGRSDTRDYYRFDLSTACEFDLSLTNLSVDATVTLYGTRGTVFDRRNATEIDRVVTRATSRNRGTADEAISMGLEAGVYYVAVTGRDTAYDLDFSAVALPENGSGATFDAALDLGDLTADAWSGSDWVGKVDSSDFYTFTLDQASDFQLVLSGLSQNADVTFYGTTEVYNRRTRLYEERLDRGIALRTRGLDDEVLSKGLLEGTYYVQVTGGDTGYDLSLTAENLPDNGAGAAYDEAVALTVTIDGDAAEVQDWVGSAIDPTDYYSFTLDGLASVTVTLGDLLDDATVSLYRDNGGRAPVLVRSATGDELSDGMLNKGLEAGTYYVSVKSGRGADTRYTLSVGAETIPDNWSGADQASALDLGVLNGGSWSSTDGADAAFDWVGDVDGEDWYAFTMDERAAFTAMIGYLGDAAVTLYGVDSRGRLKAVSSGAEMAQSVFNGDPGAPIEYMTTIMEVLDAGRYYVKVAARGGYDTPYYADFTSEALAGAGDSFYSADMVDAAVLDGTEFAGTIWSGNVADYYEFYLEGPASLSFGPAEDREFLSRYFRMSTTLYDSAGKAVTPAADWPDAERWGYELAGGTYYLAMTGRTAATYWYDADMVAGASGGAGTSDVDMAGNAVFSAYEIGALTAAGEEYVEWIGKADSMDYYSFTLDGPSMFDLSLTGLSADARVTLYSATSVYDRRQGTYVDRLAAKASSNGRGTVDEAISLGLVGGTYYVLVSGSDTAYTLNLSADPLPENGSGATSRDALDIGDLTDASWTDSDWIGSLDTNDYYKFTVGSVSEIEVALTNLSADANLAFYKGTPTSSSADKLTRVAYMAGRGTGDEIYSANLAEGTYYVQVTGRADTAYDLSIAADTIEDYAGSAMGSARDLGIVNDSLVTASDWVGALDNSDWYKVTVDEYSEVTALVTGLSGNVTLYVYDESGNRLDTAVSRNGLLAWEFADAVEPGVYYCRIVPARGVDTDYTLTINGRSDTDLGYAPVSGTDGNDVFRLSADTYTLGGGGDDTFLAYTPNAEPLAFGGAGADTYRLSGVHANLVIGDFGSSAGDTLYLPNVRSTDTAHFMLVDGSHLSVWFERTDQTVTVLNWRDNASVIENWRLADTTLTYADVVSLTDSIGLSSYDYSIEDIDSYDMTTSQLRAALDYAERLVDSGVMAVGSSADDLVVARAGLGVSTGAGDDILLNGMADSQGWLDGGAGDDTYIFTQGVHRNLNISENGTGDLGSDVIEIYGDERINSIAEDLTFSWQGSDSCAISLTVNGGVSQGEITVLGMADANTRVEELRLYANGRLVDSCLLANG